LSTDLNERHPFDVEICRIPPDKSHCPYRSHSAQWEFYHVISGKGIVRHADGITSIEAGDAFIFGQGEAHQLSNDGQEDIILYIVADNPIGESCYYPDSKKWMVRSPERRLVRSEHLVHRLAYSGDSAAGQLAVFQGASEAPISELIRAERATRKNSQPAAAQRVALKTGRRLRCSSVTYRFRHAPSSRLADRPF
jgi:uncharacterized cupin superfamily protein